MNKHRIEQGLNIIKLTHVPLHQYTDTICAYIRSYVLIPLVISINQTGLCSVAILVIICIATCMRSVAIAIIYLVTNIQCPCVARVFQI